MKFKILLRLAGIIFGVYVFVILGVYLFQDLIIFQAISLEKEYPYSFNHTNEELWLSSSNGEKINALYFFKPKSKGLVLYFHGNRGNLSRWGAMHEEFTKREYDFLIIDYQGYGKSGGKASEQNLYNDALAAYQWAIKKYQPENIIIYGRSLGSGVASNLATRVDAKMLILETPFYSIPDAIRRRVPYLWLPFRFKIQFPNYSHIDGLEMPVHILHGTNDRLVKYASANNLRPLLKCENCFVTIEGAGHKNLAEFEAYQNYISEVLK